MKQLQLLRDTILHLGNMGEINKQTEKTLLSKLNGIKKQLDLDGVMPSLLCVDSKGYSFIDNGFKYELIKEGKDYFTIYDNDGDISSYEKNCFKKL